VCRPPFILLLAWAKYPEIQLQRHTLINFSSAIMSTFAPSSSDQLEEENVPPSSSMFAGTDGSPRVSTVGTDDNAVNKRERHFAPEAVDYSAVVGLDAHWEGVRKRDYDARSVASSMAAERDDKSIYEEPAVGAVEGACVVLCCNSITGGDPVVAPA
jgi:hypothetical protein